ncbi:MAG: hypothetical protein KBA55_04375 [Ruminococcus sp.]|nr:hypothetical protein [Ruminococcus sp.]
MKKRKKRNLQGTVLFTTVSVMALLILFLVGTLTLASASNNRAHKSYSTSQASYTARATIENFTNAMSREPGIAAAVYNLSESSGSVIYPRVVIDDSSIGTIGCYDQSGAWQEGVISVESTDGNDYIYMDNDGHQLGDASMDASHASWVKLARVKISATVRVGREEETVVAYLAKRGDRAAHTTSSSPQVKGIQLVGAEAFPAGENVTGGLGVALGHVEGDEVNMMRNNMDIDTTLTFINSSLVWKTSTSQINIRKPELHDADGNPVAPTLPYSQTVINGSLALSNNKFINIDYDVPEGFTNDTWSNKEVPYVYIDGALYLESQMQINDLRGNGAPFNLFVGTMNADTKMVEMQSTSLYLMDTYDPDVKYTVYTGDYSYPPNPHSNPVQVTKGDNVIGLTGNSYLNKWAYSVANGTSTSGYDVGGSIYCKGNLKIGEARIGGDVRVEGNCTVTNNLRVEGRLIVGGTLTGQDKVQATGGIYCTGGTGMSGYTQGGVKVDDYINETQGTIVEDADENGNVTRENFFVPAGKVDPFALEEVAPNAYGAIDYLKWVPDEHRDADGNAYDALGNQLSIDDDTTTARYYFWKENYEPGMFGDIIYNINNNASAYEDVQNDLTTIHDYLSDTPYIGDVAVPFNEFDGSSDHYFGEPRVRDDRTIYTCGVPAVQGEKYFFNNDEGQIWTQSYIDTLDVIEEHYIRANIDGTRSTEWGTARYIHYIGGDPNNFKEDDEPDTKETAPVTTAPAETTTTVAETTAAPVEVNTSLPDGITEIYPSDMQREKIYGYTDASGEFYVEPSTKIITNVSEARHALGLNPNGTINPNSYPTSFPNAPTTKAYENGTKTNDTTVWTGDKITGDCVISGNVNDELVIEPHGDMYVVLDNVSLNRDLVVETAGPSSGNVHFIVKGRLDVYNSAIRPSKYKDNVDFDYTEDWGIIFYGYQDSVFELHDNCLVVGSFKMPASVFKGNVQGKSIKATYHDESGYTLTAGGDMISPSGTKVKGGLKYPSLVGNAIFADMDFQNDFVNYYTAAGSSSGATDPLGITVPTAVGNYSLLYMLAS